MTPRLVAWSQEEISVVVKEDQKKTGDYGLSLCLNIAYGEDHPLAPREGPVPRKVAAAAPASAVDVDGITEQVVSRVVADLTPKFMDAIDAKMGTMLYDMNEMLK
ncbi:uncharacterized protein LOC110699428 [Chenopodium quinoa]|uniref:uncharacterized protein LOC110699428 n=1 Tax=Chenopodium quinoa TaxID=63459 RepID=UPI000B78AAD3|nr:uncharacterized protein LOC110699428 [Chenopodium quinoa]